MLDGATLVANSKDLEFGIGPCAPTTQLSFPGDDFGRLPCAAQAVPEVKTPCNELLGFDWESPAPQRRPVAAPPAAPAPVAASRSTSLETLCDESPSPYGQAAAAAVATTHTSSFRLRVAESSPALARKPQVPDGWRGVQAQGTGQAQGLTLGQGLTHGFGAGAGAFAGSPRGKKVRRTQSMFPSSQQFLSAEMGAGAGAYSCALPPPSPGPCLPNIPTFTVKEDPFPRINSQVLIELLDGKIEHNYTQIQIIDCRFEYEYQGGHISGAINISSKDKLEELFRESSPQPHTLVVFHCEYSAYRGPLMAAHLRQCDRKVNVYPQLTFPDICVLDGGYSHFYALNKARCEPQNYVGMNDTSHRSTCEREMERFRTCVRFRKSQMFSRPSVSFSDLPRANFGGSVLEQGSRSDPVLSRLQQHQPLEFKLEKEFQEKGDSMPVCRLPLQPLNY